MNSKPLISIGVPTYNRPEGLKKTLSAITRQTYKNLQIIVSDNASPGVEVRKIVGEFTGKDNRVQFYGHEANLGPTFNFRFVLEKAEGDYFMWAADDDEWIGETFLEELMDYAPSNVLTFPDAVINGTDGNFQYPLHVYENCHTKIDYVKTFCSTGEGYPFYGLFNLRLFKERQHNFVFDPDLIYYNEGTFLHKLFLKSPVKYVKDAKIEFSTNSAKPSSAALIESFVEYFRRTVLIYALSDLAPDEKSDIFNVIFDNYTAHLNDLYQSKIATEQEKKIEGVNRIKKAIKVLMTGNI